MMKNTICRLFLVVFIIRLIPSGYCYSMEYVISVKNRTEGDRAPPRSGIQGQRLPINENEHRRLCVDAKNHLQLDPENIEFKRFDAFVKYPSDVPGTSQERYYDVLSCTTIPKIWLRFGRSSTDVIVMMINSAFVNDEGYAYNVIRISAPPVPRIHADPKRLVLVPSDRSVYGLRGTVGGLHLCWNVKKYLRRMQTNWSVVLLNYEVRAERFEFQYLNGNVTHVVLKCPSKPVLYLYMGNYEYDIKIVLEETEFPIYRY